MSTGRQRRAAGITANLTAAQSRQPTYAEAAKAALAECIRSGQAFTADDIHRRIPAEAGTDHTNNVVPSLLGVHAAAGLIRGIGAVNSTRPSRHGSRNQIWITTTAEEDMTHVQARCGASEPDPGEAGAAITVIRTDGSEVTGQVQYPHSWAGWRWVSLWDGRTPIAVQLGRGDWTFGYEAGR